MPKIIVTTDDDQVVSTINVPAPHGHIGNGTWQNVVGRLQEPLGSLGRAIGDAIKVQAGIDPERPSEKAMRLISERRSTPGFPSRKGDPPNEAA